MAIAIHPGNCPVCDAAIGAVFDTDGTSHPARPRDLLVCLNCSACLIVDADETIREPTPDELAITSQCTRYAIMGAQRAILSRRARASRAN